MKSPEVSVIIPVYNRENFLPICINSLISQTYSNWEAIVVDDGSTDSSKEIISHYADIDKRVKLFERQQLPKGASTCRNIGIEKAKGEFVMFLDSDDYLDKGCIENRVKILLQNLNYEFIVFNMRIYDGDRIKVWNTWVEEDDDLSRFLRGDGVWSITGPLFKKRVLDKFIFDEELPFWQDYIFHIVLLIHQVPYKKYLDVIDSNHVRHTSDSISQKGFSSTYYIIKKSEILFDVFTLLDKNEIQKKYYNVLLVKYISTTSNILHEHNLKLYYKLNKKLIGNIKGLRTIDVYKLMTLYFFIGLNSNNLFFRGMAYFFRNIFLDKEFNNLILRPLYIGRLTIPHDK